MDTYNTIISSISSIGFPIVCCLIMFKNNQTLQDTHKEVIDNNTLTITKLYERMETLIKGGDK
jgi:hypothetical protein